mmetsp:Transcript_9640/g.10992  ORF Transcript_9640/g.10992 Transcript_9640/m.10992 type:complete len:122 (+) Transcript_9640:205-570(+)
MTVYNISDTNSQMWSYHQTLIRSVFMKTREKNQKQYLKARNAKVNQQCARKVGTDAQIARKFIANIMRNLTQVDGMEGIHVRERLHVRLLFILIVINMKIKYAQDVVSHTVTTTSKEVQIL